MRRVYAIIKMKSFVCKRLFMDGGNWQDTGRETKLWIFNGTTSFPILLFLINISWTTFMIVVVTMLFFGILGYYGFKVSVALRFLRSKVSGGYKESRPGWAK